MTSDEWFREFERQLGPASERQAQLAAAAGCRRVWHLMTDQRHRAAVEAAERLADGELTEGGFRAALAPVVAMWAAELPPATTVEWDPGHYMTGATRHLGGKRSAADALSYASRGGARTAGPRESSGWLAALDAEGAALLALIADIVGPPSGSSAADPAWLTPTAVGLAEGIYAERAFGRLPILADALEEAGCDHFDVLAHCRGGGHHVPGCWVVDMVLGNRWASLPNRGAAADTRPSGR